MSFHNLYEMEDAFAHPITVPPGNPCDFPHCECDGAAPCARTAPTPAAWVGQTEPSTPQEMTYSATGAMRANKGKAPLHYLQSLPLSLREVCRVFEFGARKYSKHNWRKGLPPDEVVDSMFRHMIPEEFGEVFDDESGLRTSAHAAWNALVALEQELMAARTAQEGK